MVLSFLFLFIIGRGTRGEWVSSCLVYMGVIYIQSRKGKDGVRLFVYYMNSDYNQKRTGRERGELVCGLCCSLL